MKAKKKGKPAPVRLFDPEETTVRESGRGDLTRFSKRPCGWCGKVHEGLKCPA